MVKWINSLVLLAFVVVLLLRRSTRKSLLPLQKELADATNVLLTEYYLAAHDLAAVSPYSKALADSVCSMCRARGFPNATEELVARQFNRHDRFTQLNVIAMALHHDGTEPPLPREYWRPSRNPFSVERDPGSISAVSARLLRDHGVKIDIGETPLRFVDQYILSS